MSDEENVDSNNILRIMLSTDNHLGYGEKDPIRGEDSFIAFEEMLELAVREDVDFILLGGDLFHDAVPSQNTLHKCIRLLRMYTFGDKPITVELLSDGSKNFYGSINQSVNYEDPNLNVAIPVYSIHGNHDDPNAFGGLSSLDLLSSMGLINYFGRWTDLTQIEISPILMRKGVTHLALYGLSHIHDARLCRLFESHKVNIQTPTEDSGIEWFHLMVLHQNRADRGPKNYLPEVALPEFLNLIIWGHEHDCRIEPELNGKRNFYVSQPGSTVPTSLSEGEALKKHVAILEIYKNKFQIKPIPLSTVRPFLFESVNVNDVAEELLLDEGDVSNKVKAMAQERIEALLEKAKNLITGNPRQPKLPTLRLRIIFSDEEQMFNGIRLGQTFNDRVANPMDIVHFKKVIKREKHEKNRNFDKDEIQAELKKMTGDSVARVEDLVERYFDGLDDSKSSSLKVLSSKALTELCHQLVDRNDHLAAENLIKSYKTKALNHLISNMVLEDNVDIELDTFKHSITTDDVLNLLGSTSASIVSMTATTTTSTAAITTANPTHSSTSKNASDISEDDDPIKGNITNVSKKQTDHLKRSTDTDIADGSNDRGDRAAGGSRGRRVCNINNLFNRSIQSPKPPPLDITTTTKEKRSGRKQTILNVLENNLKNVPPKTKSKVFVISDDDESD